MNYYSESENQRSEKMMLEEGQDYLLVSEFADSSGHDYINVRVSSSANIYIGYSRLPSSLSYSFSLLVSPFLTTWFRLLLPLFLSSFMQCWYGIAINLVNKSNK